jgi:hypothetical protein
MQDAGKYDMEIDPRGLIYEAYRMDIGPAGCRTIFLDWALGQPDNASSTQIKTLLARYGTSDPEHPMTAVLRQGLQPASDTPRRKGGRRGRQDGPA